MKYEHLVWPKDHTVNDAALDEHHQRFVDVANGVIDIANSEKTDVDELLRLLTQLGNQVLYHFETEEVHLKKLNFPEADAHMKLHEEQREALRRFIAEARELQKACKGETDCRALTEKVADFVTEWVNKHMLGNTGSEAFFTKMRDESGG